MREAGPRTPLRVAVMTFGAIVLVGTLISLAVLSGNGILADHPSKRGELIGQGLGMLGLVCAAVAYVVQRARLKRGPK